MKHAPQPKSHAPHNQHSPKVAKLIEAGKDTRIRAGAPTAPTAPAYTNKADAIAAENRRKADAVADPADLSVLPARIGNQNAVEAEAQERRRSLETAAANLGVTTAKAKKLEKIYATLACLNQEFGLTLLVSKFYISGATYSYLSDKGMALYAPDNSIVALGDRDILVTMRRLIELAKKEKARTAKNLYRAKRASHQSKKGYLTNV